MTLPSVSRTPKSVFSAVTATMLACLELEGEGREGAHGPTIGDRVPNGCVTRASNGQSSCFHKGRTSAACGAACAIGPIALPQRARVYAWFTRLIIASLDRINILRLSLS